MDISKVHFATDDKQKLMGLLYMPKYEGINKILHKKTKKVVIFVHGMYSNCLKYRDDIFARELTKNGIAYFTFNNRGAEVGTLLKDKLCGAAFENPRECIYDIEAAIKCMKLYGFEDINVLGHSLGCTKILYWYQRKNEKISTIALLSLSATSDKYKQIAGSKNYNEAIEYAKHLKNTGAENVILPFEIYPKPISAKTFLDLFDEASDFNIIRYEDENWSANELCQIEQPLFLRFGTENETITKCPEDTVKLIKEKIKNEKLDVDFIQNADHSYHGREEELINQYINFLTCI